MQILRSLEDKGIVGLGFWLNGFTQLSSNKKIISPNDLRGLKFRTLISDIRKDTFGEFGAKRVKNMILVVVRKNGILLNQTRTD